MSTETGNNIYTENSFLTIKDHGQFSLSKYQVIPLISNVKAEKYLNTCDKSISYWLPDYIELFLYETGLSIKFYSILLKKRKICVCVLSNIAFKSTAYLYK